MSFKRHSTPNSVSHLCVLRRRPSGREKIVAEAVKESANGLGDVTSFAQRRHVPFCAPTNLFGGQFGVMERGQMKHVLQCVQSQHTNAGGIPATPHTVRATCREVAALPPDGMMKLSRGGRSVLISSMPVSSHATQPESNSVRESLLRVAF